MINVILPYLYVFLMAFVLTLILTPIVREVNRKLGMVDKPDPRRINIVPIPRGGGMAVMLGVTATYLTLGPILGFASATGYKITALAVSIALLGIVDDKYSLPPKLKLLGQLLIALAAWGWAGVGFKSMFPALPAYLDCIFTVFWITGAINAFNLIDGLDGLASGLALIATLGMSGALFFVGRGDMTIAYFALIGGLLAFLRYNYHPASIFLGDSGSMYIGFLVSVMPLIGRSPNSFLVSVGVPILAMGVPIFDTSLAILRRSIRHILLKKTAVGEKGQGEVMTADKDHLHHRILRSSGLNQRKAAWTLYAIAVIAVAFGLAGMALQSKAGGMWLLAIAIASVVIFKDMAQIELYDAGKLLNTMAHDKSHKMRRRIARFTTPLHLIADIVMIGLAYLVYVFIFNIDINADLLKTAFTIRLTTMLFFLFVMNTYRTTWSRAMLSNYIRLILAAFFGTVASSVIIYYIPRFHTGNPIGSVLIFFLLSAVFLVSIRFLRAFVRDTLYALDCASLKSRKDVSRVLVYGAGLRYKAFRRELVRRSTTNDRIIVGIIDDDITLRGKYIGGIKIMGTLSEAPEIINAVNADQVVIACEIDEEWLGVIKDMLKNSKVKVTHFNFNEKEIM
ncbi:MAG: hypothetical protein MJ109_02610 [Kiritimatiellae bacterium]|nr:hypothetical protein [Kiritimatiellia bacterium]